MSGLSMKRLTHGLRRFAADQRGATAIEYALIAVGIAGAIIGIINTIGGTVLNDYYAEIAEAFKQ